MKRLEVTSGAIYGDLVVIREVECAGKRQFLCKCSCGQKTNARLGHLTSGHTKSCGRCGILFQGKRKTIREWAGIYGLNESTLRARLKVAGIREALGRK